MTTQRLALNEAMRISEMAFLPCHATAKADHEDASFSLRVVDAVGDEILSISHIARSQYTDPIHLAGLLENARLQLSRDGVSLGAWSMPAQPGTSE
ncbi:hypothetical protein [Pseudomonas sp. SST3]|uniref:hypothetical protein n=1 Tax=Pseudomonas sp. SST3 TaxID=2267882 RepID=UPI000DFBDEE6|nr:hypothetical protein [Pseudomonas sp. SST3]NKQ10526.1 hypothetical protein [Pseudomonas sp. SST3]